MIILTVLDSAVAFFDDLHLDTGTLLRLGIGIIILLAVLRLIGRGVWATARLFAALLVMLVLLALLFGKPSRIGDLVALRQSAIDAARDLFE
jgi:hypothetical protein